MAALLQNGVNVVTTCTDLIAGGLRLGEVLRGSSRRRVRKGQHLPVGERERSRVHHRDRPDGLALGAASGGPDRDRGVWRSLARPSPHMVMEQMRFGKPLSEFDPDRRKNHLFGEYQPALTVLADMAGFTIDEWTAEGGVAAAKEDLEIVAGEIRAGTAAAQRIVVQGRSGGVDRIRFTQYAFVSRDVDPDWGLQPTGWRIRVHGDAPFDVSMPFPVPLGRLGFVRTRVQCQWARQCHPLRLCRPPGHPHHRGPAPRPPAWPSPWGRTVGPRSGRHHRRCAASHESTVPVARHRESPPTPANLVVLAVGYSRSQKREDHCGR